LRQPESGNRVILPQLLGLIYAVSAIILKTLPLPHPTIIITFNRLDSITVKRKYFGSSETKRVRKYPVMNKTRGIDTKTGTKQNPERLLGLNRHVILIKFMPDSIQGLKIFRWYI